MTFYRDPKSDVTIRRNFVAGVPDDEGARQLGISREAYKRRRLRLRLMPERQTATRLYDLKARELWERGWIDRQIAAKLGGSQQLVCMWRHRHGLRANAPSGSEDWRALAWFSESQREVLQLHADGIGDAEGAKILGITRDAYRRRRLRLGLPAKAVRMKRADPTGRF